MRSKRELLVALLEQADRVGGKSGNTVASLQNEDFTIPQISVYISQRRKPSLFAENLINRI